MPILGQERIEESFHFDRIFFPDAVFPPGGLVVCMEFSWKFNPSRLWLPVRKLLSL
jgi:hypothetical protein